MFVLYFYYCDFFVAHVCTGFTAHDNGFNVIFVFSTQAYTDINCTLHT